MAPPASVVVTIVDEGYFKKVFRFSPTTALKKPLDAYRAQICRECTDIGLLEFWFESTKISDTDTAEGLGIQTGDIIDIHLSTLCTRGACPIPPTQTTPNIHYLAAPPAANPAPPDTPAATSPSLGSVQEAPEEPRPRRPRVTLKIREMNGYEMVVRTKVDTPLAKVMDAFAAALERGKKELRFCVDGERITDGDTPEMLELEEDQLIEVYYESTGGSALG